MSGPFMVQKMMVDRLEEASFFISSIPWGESNIDDIFLLQPIGALDNSFIIHINMSIENDSEPKLRRSNVSHN